MDIDLAALDTSGVLSLFIEAYMQEMGVSETESQESRDRIITHILLALFGWEQSNPNELECRECGRRAGMWNYSSSLHSFVRHSFFYVFLMDRDCYDAK